MLEISITIGFLLFLWNRSDFFVEYLMVFKIPLLKKYQQIYIFTPEVHINDYLAEEYADSFFIKIITCPICLVTWMGIIASIISSTLLISFVYSAIGLSVYYTLIYLQKISSDA